MKYSSPSTTSYAPPPVLVTLSQRSRLLRQQQGLTLRNLATKSGLSLRFLMDVEAGRVSHMLCGRCSFIFERELEQAQRGVEAAVGAGRWAEAPEHRAEFGALLGELRVRLLASSVPTAPPA